MLRTILFASLIASVYCHSLAKREDSAFAELVDEFLYEAVNEVKAKGQEQVVIPEIHEEIVKKWKFLKLKGEFTGTGGWFKNLSSIQRVGDVVVNQGDDTITVGLGISLKEMEFGFKEYRAEVYHIGVHGKMDISVEQNAIFAQLTMKFGEKDCHTTVDKLEVTKLDGFRVQITGLGRDADFVYSWVVQYLTNKYHDKVKKSVTDALVPRITDALKKHDICEKFPH